MCAHTHIHTKSLIFRSECTHSSGADPALLLMQWERKGLAISMNCSGFDKGTSAKKKQKKKTSFITPAIVFTVTLLHFQFFSFPSQRSTDVRCAWIHCWLRHLLFLFLSIFLHASVRPLWRAFSKSPIIRTHFLLSMHVLYLLVTHTHTENHSVTFSTFI